MARWRWRRHTKHAAAKRAPEATGRTVGADRVHPARAGSRPPAKRGLGRPRVWDRDRVLAAISEYAEAHDGRPPSAAIADRTGLRYAARREFGMWSTAVRAAGYRPLAKMPRRATHSDMLETLARYEAGATVTELAAYYGVSRQAIHNRLRRASEPALPNRRRIWDRDQVLAALAGYADAHDDTPPTIRAVKHIGGLRQAACREFGSWAKAVKAAGYEPRPPGRPAGSSLIWETHAHRKAGTTVAELAAYYGVSRKTIYERLDRARELLAKATSTPMETPGPDDPTPPADRTTPAPLELVPEPEPSWVPTRLAVTLGDDGRVALPVGMRGALGLRPGTRMVLTTEPDGSLRLRPCRTAADGRLRSPSPPSPQGQVGSGGPGATGQLP